MSEGEMRKTYLLAGVVGLVLIVSICAVLIRSRGARDAPRDPPSHPQTQAQSNSDGSAVHVEAPDRIELLSGNGEVRTPASNLGLLMDMSGRPLAGVRVSIRGDDGKLTLREGMLLESAGGLVHSLVITEALKTALKDDPAKAETILSEFNDKEQALRLVLNGESPPGIALTSVDGEFPCPASHDIVELIDDEYIVVAEASLHRNRSTVRVFIAARGIQLAGRVQDEASLPIEGVLVSTSSMERTHIRSFPHPIHEVRMLRDTRPLPLRAARTDAWGRFDLGRVPAVPGLQVLVTDSEHWAKPQNLPSTDNRDVLIVMRKKERKAAAVKHIASGTVIDHLGDAAAGALVLLGNERTIADTAGFFTIRLAQGHLGTANLVALKEGYQPAIVENMGDRLNAEGDIKDIVMVLGPECVTLTGRVLDEFGNPRASVDIYVTNPILPSSCHMMSDLAIEETRSTSDVHGRFSLHKLSAREYLLRIVEPSTAVSIDAGPFRAGLQDLQISFPSTGNSRIVRGVLRSEAGRPVGGVTVTAVTQIAGDEYCRRTVDGGSTMSDDNGAFQLENCSSTGLCLRLQGWHTDGQLLDLSHFDLTQPLTLTIPAYHRILVRLHEINSGSADYLSFRDATDLELLFLPTTLSGVGSMFNRVRIQELVEEPIRVPERATSLVLLRGDEEVRRIPLPECNPGETRSVP
jgi:hypothetical protein